MPCEYYTPGEEARMARQELNIVTALLCATCRRIQRHEEAVGHPLNPPSLIESVPGLRAWWDEHQERDRRREAAERQAAESAAKRESDRKAGLSKLTAEERRALGLDYS